MTAISVHGLVKRFGRVVAVDDLSFEVQPGTLTGFVGPNGAGKTTTLRMILGLVRPTAGTTLVDGVPYARLDRPARHVGAVLEASGFHPGRTARDHLHVLAMPSGILTVAATVTEQGGIWHAEQGAFFRTQRRLFDGHVYVRAPQLDTRSTVKPLRTDAAGETPIRRATSTAS